MVGRARDELQIDSNYRNLYTQYIYPTKSLTCTKTIYAPFTFSALIIFCARSEEYSNDCWVYFVLAFTVNPRNVEEFWKEHNTK